MDQSRPPSFAALTRRGRPRSPNKLVQVTLRLDPQALASYQATGPGWQGRINEAVIAGSRRLPQSSAAEEVEAVDQAARRTASERVAKRHREA